jgi:hypothetical protein
MNKKLFGRAGRQRQLAELYRTVEAGGEVLAADPALRAALDADQPLIQQLRRLSAESGPVNPAIGRATLLSEVARKKSHAPEMGQTTMMGRLLTSRGLALLATAGIFAGGAVTVGASGGVSGAAGNANSVLSTLHITHQTHNQGHGNPQAGAQPDATRTPTADGTQRAIKGIPTDNPQHQLAAATCVKGETSVKTLPSGVAVNVPCQAAEDHAQGTGNGQASADKTRGSDGTPQTETPEATETNLHSGESAGHTPAALPTQANGHASERAPNGPDR